MNMCNLYVNSFVNPDIMCTFIGNHTQRIKSEESYNICSLSYRTQYIWAITQDFGTY